MHETAELTIQMCFCKAVGINGVGWILTKTWHTFARKVSLRV